MHFNQRITDPPLPNFRCDDRAEVWLLQTVFVSIICSPSEKSLTRAWAVQLAARTPNIKSTALCERSSKPRLSLDTLSWSAVGVRATQAFLTWGAPVFERFYPVTPPSPCCVWASDEEGAVEAANRYLIPNRAVAKGPVQFQLLLRQRVVMAAQKAQADVLLHRLHYALLGWDAAAERRDAQGEFHSGSDLDQAGPGERILTDLVFARGRLGPAFFFRFEVGIVLKLRAPLISVGVRQARGPPCRKQ
jgi:hypothetical protein